MHFFISFAAKQILTILCMNDSQLRKTLYLGRLTIAVIVILAVSYAIGV